MSLLHVLNGSLALGNAFPIGSMVVLKEDNMPPLYWKIGRIISSHPGQDGIVRVASVKTEAAIYKKGVNKLCPLLMEELDISKKT